MDYGFVTPYYKIHLHIPTSSIKSHCWLLCKSANVGKLLETLLKDICRKVSHGFPCGSDDLLG
jgi:hypothetical protein